MLCSGWTITSAITGTPLLLVLGAVCECDPSLLLLHLRSKQSTVLVVSHDADFLDSVCSDILHLDDAQITSYKGDYSYFESLLGKILAKKEKQYQIQMKTMREFTKGNGQLSQEKAEKKTMQKLNISSLREKPREYKVNFVLHAAEDDSPAIDMLDVSFRYSGQFLFERVRLKVQTLFPLGSFVIHA